MKSIWRRIVFLCFVTKKLLLLSAKVNKWSQKCQQYGRAQMVSRDNSEGVTTADHALEGRATCRCRVSFWKQRGLVSFVMCPARQMQLCALQRELPSLSVLEMFPPSAPYSAGGSCRVTRVLFTLPLCLLALCLMQVCFLSNFNVLSVFKISKLYWHVCCGTGRSDDGSYQLPLLALVKALTRQDRAWQICSEHICCRHIQGGNKRVCLLMACIHQIKSSVLIK